MAKNSSSRGSTPSRIRFIMVEAELGDGDVGQITRAIQNALRPPPPPSVKRIAPATQGHSKKALDGEVDGVGSVFGEDLTSGLERGLEGA